MEYVFHTNFQSIEFKLLSDSRWEEVLNGSKPTKEELEYIGNLYTLDSSEAIKEFCAGNTNAIDEFVERWKPFIALIS